MFKKYVQHKKIGIISKLKNIYTFKEGLKLKFFVGGQPILKPYCAIVPEWPSLAPGEAVQAYSIPALG